MIEYQTTADGITPEMLGGFFDGWPDPPSPSAHLRILEGSDEVVVAIDRSARRVVGFITAITDGVLCAYIPLLEVLPEYKGRGIGTELTRRMLERLQDFYMADLVCDGSLQPFYERFGFVPGVAMMRRSYARQSGRPPAELEI